MRAVRKHQLEGIVAKRAGSSYRSGERCSDWVKWRANRGQEFVIGGYIANGNMLDSLLVGYYGGRELMYAASIRAGILLEFRRALLPHETVDKGALVREDRSVGLDPEAYRN
jgi:ATP-dependent DNA ligase